MHRGDVRVIFVLAIGVAACHRPKAAPLAAAGAAVTATHDEIAAGGFDTCARRTDGAFWCWGENKLGQLGDGTTTDQTSPVKMIGSEDFESVALSGDHTCALTKKHVVRCWGHNLYGEAGSPALVMDAPATDVLDDVVRISIGAFVSCAVRRDKTVWCWGMNDNHQLGDGSTANRSVPAPVVGLADVVSVSVGDGTACALTTAGEVKCWGYDDYGACGVGDHSIFRKRHTVAFPTAVALASPATAKDVALGGFEACFVASDATLRCWGQGSYGALGNGGTSNEWAPQTLTWANAIDAVSIGGFAHACARRADGTVWCWGYGIGGTDDRLAPENVAGLVVTELALGHTHACGRRTDGAISCWGNNSEGQLGNGSHVSSSRPIVIVPP